MLCRGMFFDVLIGVVRALVCRRNGSLLRFLDLLIVAQPFDLRETLVACLFLAAANCPSLVAAYDTPPVIGDALHNHVASFPAQRVTTQAGDHHGAVHKSEPLFVTQTPTANSHCKRWEYRSALLPPHV
ncbi:unnamed protein product [Periconia digitata]|uniref:Secreted protein n=1 Tax=Periconia digitata TaxID=1303443 RepID=A0A9W4UAP5_9PLEO|nr:unnamed protein product [Periconia digitata]